MKKMYTLSMYIQSLDMLLVKHQPERPIETQEIPVASNLLIIFLNITLIFIGSQKRQDNPLIIYFLYVN